MKPKPLFHVRPGPGRPRRRENAPPVEDYAPGHFTALLWPTHNWPHAGWRPTTAAGTLREGPAAQRRASEVRSRALAEGRGYALGTVPQPNTPKTLMPGWMK